MIGLPTLLILVGVVMDSLLVLILAAVGSGSDTPDGKRYDGD